MSFDGSTRLSLLMSLAPRLPKYTVFDGYLSLLMHQILLSKLEHVVGGKNKALLSRIYIKFASKSLL